MFRLCGRVTRTAIVAVALVATVSASLQIARAGTDQAPSNASHHEADAGDGHAELQRQVNNLRGELLDQRESLLGLQQAGAVALAVLGILVGIGGILALIKSRGGSQPPWRWLQARAEAPGQAVQEIRVLLPGASDPAFGTALRADGSVYVLPVALPLETVARGASPPGDALPSRSLSSTGLPTPVLPLEGNPCSDTAMPPDPDIGPNGRGDDDVRQFRYEKRVADCTEAIRREPDEARHHVERAEALSELGRHDEALADYDVAILLDPCNAAAYMGRCHAKADLGRHDEAISDFDAAVGLDPSLATEPEDE